MRRNGDRGLCGGDREILDRGYGFHRTGDRWLPDRWLGMPGSSVIPPPVDEPVLADSWPVSHRDGYDYSFSNNVIFIGQAVTGTGGNLYSAKFMLQKNGAPTGSLKARLYSGSGSFPAMIATGPVLATSTTNLDSSTVTTGVTYEFLFPAGVPYTSGAKYVIGLEMITATTSNNIGLGTNFNNNVAPKHYGNIAFLDAGLGGWQYDDLEDLIFYLYTTGAAPAPPFDPSTIAGLKVWLKADAITTPGFLQRPVPGQQPGDDPVVEPFAINDGDTVISWPDSSGNGNGVGAYQLKGPTYRVAGLNSKPCLQFDGVDDNLVNTGLTGLQPNTIIAVYDTGNPVTSDINGQILNPDNVHVGMYAGTSVNSAVTLVSGTFIIQTVVVNGVSSFIYVNGTLVLGPANFGTHGYNILCLNNYAQNQGPAAGKIAEILIYDSALSATDRQNVENYLKSKYGLP